MLKIWAIARTTFKEAIRNRILYILLVFALLLIASSGVISDLSIAAHDRIIKDLGVFGISAFGLLIAVFVGISLIYNEMDKKTIYTIISKPINRNHYILGKFLGLLLTIYVIMLFMTFFFMAVVYFFEYMKDENLNKALWSAESGQWEYAGHGAYLLYILKAFAGSALKSAGTLLQVYDSVATANIMAVVSYSALELAIVTAFAILYSTFTTPTLSAIFTVLTFIIGRMNEDIVRYSLHVLEKEGTGMKYHLANGAALISPNFSMFNKTNELIYSTGPIGFDATAVSYGLFYMAGVLLLAMTIFRRRNLK